MHDFKRAGLRLDGALYHNARYQCWVGAVFFRSTRTDAMPSKKPTLSQPTQVA